MARSLYDTLGLTQTATQAEIKKAYHAMCLRLHPDKNPGDETAVDKFQALQRVYSVLGDPEKRKVYDETGLDDLGVTGDQFDQLYKYYRDVYAKVTEDDISGYERTYRGSAEEERDLKELFARFGGDMSQVFDWLCCSRPDVDSHRFLETLRLAVDRGELKGSKKFEQWAKQVARKPAPADPLAVHSSAGGGGAGGSDASQALVAAIRGRAQQGSSFLDALAAKHGGAAGKRSSKRSEPSDEQFAAAQARVKSKR